MNIRYWFVSFLVLLFCQTACGPNSSPAIAPPEEEYAHLGLSESEVDSLLSLEQIDDYPLYTMHHYEAYEIGSSADTKPLTIISGDKEDQWACSLFAALADPDARLYGRNFDWEFSPALLLFTDPPNGYASAAMVDIAYLGFEGVQSENLTTKPLSELIGLLDAPFIPFDGMNEAGLTIGMAAVPPGNVPADPNKVTVGSLGIIRILLDRAATVAEAVDMLLSYNIDFEGGPPIHYLIADAQGDAALVEHYQGEIHILRSETDWHQATNFLNTSVESPQGQCRRYDAIAERLQANQGMLDFDGALSMLQEVAQLNTQWSVVYSASSGEIRVVMGRDYERVHTFQLEMSVE